MNMQITELPAEQSNQPEKSKRDANAGKSTPIHK